MSIRVERTVTSVVHAEVDRETGRLFRQDMVGETCCAAGRRIATNSCVEELQVPLWEPRREIEFDIRGVLILLGDTVPEEQDAILRSEEELVALSFNRSKLQRADQEQNATGGS
jgi:hypothetical protein